MILLAPRPGLAAPGPTGLSLRLWGTVTRPTQQTPLRDENKLRLLGCPPSTSLPRFERGFPTHAKPGHAALRRLGEGRGGRSRTLAARGIAS
eukprot:195935-Rhodomonas_salina.3